MMISVHTKKEDKIEVDVIEPMEGHEILVTLGSAYIYLDRNNLDRLIKQSLWAQAEIDLKGGSD